MADARVSIIPDLPDIRSPGLGGQHLGGGRSAGADTVAVQAAGN